MNCRQSIPCPNLNTLKISGIALPRPGDQLRTSRRPPIATPLAILSTQRAPCLHDCDSRRCSLPRPGTSCSRSLGLGCYPGRKEEATAGRECIQTAAPDWGEFLADFLDGPARVGWHCTTFSSEPNPDQLPEISRRRRLCAA